MIGKDLRQKNARLHDRIEQVLQMHPELRDGAEAIALGQDLYVEVGTPFLERQIARASDRRAAPELECYFDDLTPAKVFWEISSRESQLEAALCANSALRVQAERLIAAYVAPESDRAVILHELIALFDGPAQREAQTLAAQALGEAWREHLSGACPQVTL
jgi:hypothetical protein